MEYSSRLSLVVDATLFPSFSPLIMGFEGFNEVVVADEKWGHFCLRKRGFVSKLNNSRLSSWNCWNGKLPGSKYGKLPGSDLANCLGVMDCFGLFKHENCIYFCKNPLETIKL
jgi:hypothetical protein